MVGDFAMKTMVGNFATKTMDGNFAMKTMVGHFATKTMVGNFVAICRVRVMLHRPVPYVSFEYFGHQKIV